MTFEGMSSELFPSFLSVGQKGSGLRPIKTHFYRPTNAQPAFKSEIAGFLSKSRPQSSKRWR
jgi:hypothetical protein